jgi:hypothetical protein
MQDQEAWLKVRGNNCGVWPIEIVWPKLLEELRPCLIKEYRNRLSRLEWVAAAPVVKLINSQWAPVNQEEQRNTGIESAASILPLIEGPNLAAGIDATSIELIVEPLLRPIGFARIKVKSERQLLRIEAKFARDFGQDELPADSEIRELITTLKPSIVGTVAASLGVTSAASNPNEARIQLKLLPGVSSIHVEKLKLRDNADLTTAAQSIASLLTHYSERL